MTTACNQAPPRYPLDQPRAGRLNVGYRPQADSQLIENPPRFAWMPVIEDEANYVLELSTEADFPSASTQGFKPIPINFFTPDVGLAPGNWYWRYAVWSTEEERRVSTWSEVREFTLSGDLPHTPLQRREQRTASLPLSHPRLWLGPDALARLRQQVADDPDYCGWHTFYQKSVLPWMDRDIMREPAGYPDHKRVASIWRQTYIDCQEALYAVRHLAIAGKVTANTDLLARAREWLLALASWNPAGTTSRSYTDEWAFRVNLALAWGYDWLQDELDDEQRALVRESLLRRTRETAEHITRQARIQLFPYDSHAVRAVSAVLVPASIALLHESEEARDWLDFSIEFLFTVYSPWGDNDGGWAEGSHYWMTGMAYLIDAANMLRNYAGIDLYQRPFLQLTANFPLYTKPPRTRRGTFGDDSTMGDLPGLKVAYNLRQFAGVTGNGHYQWYFEEIKRNDPGTEMEFYNYGWWDLAFDDLVYRHDFPAVEAVPPDKMPKLAWFRGIGWASIQYRQDDPHEHISLITKASQFGSISHSHGDQNAFCLSAFGEDLAIQSGYYVAFNSSMHRQWRRQTRSKNALLIDGKGQYADHDKSRAMRATGRITRAEEHEDHVFICGDATEAYRSLNPAIELVERHTWFVHDRFFVIVDIVDAAEAVELDWRIHSQQPMALGNSTFRYSGERAGLYGQFLWSEAGAATLSQDTGFPGVDPDDYAGLPVSTCVNARFPRARRHRIATLLVPYPLSAPRRVFTFLDDQGYDCDLYFTDADERDFRIVVPKSFHVGD